MVGQNSRAAPGVTARWERRYREALDAAAAAFAEGGYLAVSTTDIANRLNIRQGSLYYYFASKEAALTAICEIGVKGFIDRLGEILAAPLPAAAKLRLAVANHLLPLRSRPAADYVRVFIRHRHELPNDARRKISILARSYQGYVEQLFRDGIVSKQFRQSLDPKLATFAFLGLCNSVIAAPVLPRGISIDQIVEEYAQILAEGVEACK